MKRELTRTREHGRKVYSNQDGTGIILACREIKASGSYAKINGVTVDTFSASAIVAVHDACTPTNRLKFLSLSVTVMARVAFKCIG